jgi:1-acyl-sn-glycerol-3-phosphate acyltransferase
VIWTEGTPPEDAPLGPLGWALAITRLALIAVVIYGLMIFLLVARLIETPFGRRPVSPGIVQLASWLSLKVMNLPIRVHGRPMTHRGAIVSNHCSWLDIFSLNAAARVYFVSKAEVSKWPAIGQVARSTGTVFIERKASHAAKQKSQFEERLLAGDRLLFFPEGTSTDGRRILPFKSTLFAAFFAPDLRETMWIQPASLIYHAPKGEDSRYFGWWGDMDFGPHFLKTLGTIRQGRIEVVFHDPVAVSAFKDRKALTAHCEKAVREGLERIIGPAPAP